MVANTEELYLESTKKVRTSLPKFVIFLGAALLVWIVGSILLIPLGQGIMIYGIEASKVINLIVIATIIAFVFATFREIRILADACAGFVMYYAGNNKPVDKRRIDKLKGAFRSLSYVILISLIFVMFKSLLDAVHPALAGIAVIVIAVWVIISLYSVVMVMGSEIEEAARVFADELERKVKKRRVARR